MHDSPTTVVLALGANIGNRMATLRAAVEQLAASALQDITCSVVYATEPVGYTNQPAFLNMAIRGNTMLPVHELARTCRAIEVTLGRMPRAKWHEREIDIDIVFFGDSVTHDDALDVPHPRMHERRFVLQPCADVAAEMIHPELQHTVRHLLQTCPDTAAVEAFGSIAMEHPKATT